LSRRTRAQQQTDDLAFPIRVKFTVPERGLGDVSNRMHEWLRQEVGGGRFAVHSAQAISSSAVGVYFVSLDDARRFVDAFPAMEIANGTRCSTYTAANRVQQG
tara:strand:- start:43 stop:351 length:309 start_codon:yes stop_codon:yes gene_type:complete